MDTAASAIGPSFGGFLVGAVGWRAVFWALVSLVAVAFAMGAACIRRVSRTERASLGLPGLAMLAVWFASFIFAANGTSSAGWASQQAADPAHTAAATAAGTQRAFMLLPAFAFAFAEALCVAAVFGVFGNRKEPRARR